MAVGEDVADQPQGLGRREDVGAAGDVLLEHVVLDRAGERGGVDAVLLGDQLVEQQQRAAGALIVIDVETWSSGMPSKSTPHVVDRVDGHADLADLAVRDRVVGVVAHLGRQVEGDGQPAGAGRDQLVVARVGLLGGAEPGVLAHGPRAGRCTSRGRRRG